MTTAQITTVDELTDLSNEDIVEELKASGVNPHHKTGRDKLMATLVDVRNGVYNQDKKATYVAAPPLTKTQLATRMQRIVVTPNDPNMSSYSGLIFTAGSSKVNNGRMIKKYVPFNNDEGWHVPQILIDQIEAAEMQKFRTITLPNGKKGKEAYLTKKFNVKILPPLTVPEMEALAAAQRSRGTNR